MSAHKADSPGHDAPTGADSMEFFVNGLRDTVTIGTEILKSFADTRNPGMESLKPGTAKAETLVAVAPYMAEAAAIALRSWARYGQGLADIAGRRQMALIQGMAAGADVQRPNSADRGALVDEFRGYLREVAETALREARHLEQDLSQLSESLAGSVTSEDSSDAYRRAWRVKP